MHGDEPHTKRLAHHEHKAVACAKELSDKFSVSGKGELIAADGFLVDRPRHQCVDNTRLQVFACATDCLQCGLTRVRRGSTWCDFNLLVPTVYDVGIFDSEVAALFHLVIAELLKSEQFLIVR